MREDVSALMDGELVPGHSTRVMDALKRDSELRDAWASYHLVGDSLRRQLGSTSDLSGRVMAQLASEPTVIGRPVDFTASRPMARYLVPLVASVAGLGVVGWLALSASPPAPTVQIVKAPASTLQPVVTQAAAPSAPAPVMPVSAPLSSALMHEYLIAHQAYSPSTDIQGMAPYIRTVTETRRAADR